MGDSGEMVPEFVKAWNERKDRLRSDLEKTNPSSYSEIVKAVASVVLNPEFESGLPDATNVTEIDHGDYQGTLVFVIPEVGYQPSTYWVVKVSYGSCSVCDTLQACKSIDDYMTLALHIIQGLRRI